MKSGNSLKKSGRKSKCQAKKPAKTYKGNNQLRVITEEREPFVFQLAIKGKGCPEIAKRFAEKFGVTIDQSNVNRHLKKPAYKKFKDEWLSNVKQEPMSYARYRIDERREIADDLKPKIVEILALPARSWQEFHLGILIREYRNILNDIAEEAGDKRKEGDKEHQTIIQIINTIPGMFADGNSSDAGKENTKARRGFRLDRS